jgi:hypothetical protein
MVTFLVHIAAAALPVALLCWWIIQNKPLSARRLVVLALSLAFMWIVCLSTVRCSGRISNFVITIEKAKQ